MATPNKGLTLPASGSDIGTWDVPTNGNFTTIDTALGGTTTINVTGASGTVVLTSTQYTPPNWEFTGTLTANVNYQIPSGVGLFSFAKNGATGAFTITVSSAGAGTSVVVPANTSALLVCDGTNVRFGDTIATGAAGITGSLQYNNAGAIAGSSNVTTDGFSVSIGGDLTVALNLTLNGFVLTPLKVSGGSAATFSRAVAFSATAMAVNCAISNVFTTTLTANVTVAPALSGQTDGQTINWYLTQDATGSRTMTWPAAFKWVNGAVGVLSTTPNARDLLVASYLSATGNWYCSLLKGFA